MIKEIRDVATSKAVTSRCPREVDLTDAMKPGGVAGTEELCKGCPFHIKAPDYLNCSLVAQEFGPFSLNEIAEMEQVPRFKIERIEQTAIRKFVKEIFKDKRYEKFRRYIQKRFNVPSSGGGEPDGPSDQSVPEESPG